MPITAPTPSVAADDEALVCGHDATPHIVAVHPVRQDAEATPALMHVYRRQQPHQPVSVQEEPYYPFFFLTEMRLLRGFPRHRLWCKTLQGNNAYQHLVVCPSRHIYHQALRHLEVVSEGAARQQGQVYRVASPVQQYLMHSGRTLFKAMDFDALHRLQLDIEVLSAPGSFPQPQHPEDRIVIIALADNRGWSQLIEGRQLSERAMLESLIDTLCERDPDVIEGHNIYAFDLAYIMARCERYGLPFAIGRDGSVPRTFPSSMRFAERTVDFPAVDIAGRHVIDTYFQVMTYDVFKRDLPGYGLKTAARYFGLAAENRTYIDGQDITQMWHRDSQQLLNYAGDDVIETERLARHLSGSTFYLTQMLPMSYGQVARTGPAAKIEALLVREYLRRRQALPCPGTGSQMRGGYTEIFVTGVMGPMVYADVESLYPSLMLTHHIKPQSDDLELFQTLLSRLTALRLHTKSRMQAASRPDVRSALDAQQSSYKILINSFYGQLGFQKALFNDFAAADRVAAEGQKVLRQLIAAIRQAEGTVVEVDTDGVLFVPPATIDGEAAERAFVQGVSAEMPAGIRLGYDGRFRSMLSYKVKNYALLGYDGRLQCKGSSLVSRSLEPFGRRFVLEAIALLLKEDIAALHDVYLQTRARIIQHDWTVEDFARTETLKESATQYQADVLARRRTRSATYELAIARTQRTGQPLRKGDRITYYVTGTEANVTTFDHAALAERWQAHCPDENTAYYLRRLDEWTRKFAPFFTPHDFQQVFTPDDLFGFSATGIRLQTTWHRHDASTEYVRPEMMAAT